MSKRTIPSRSDAQGIIIKLLMRNNTMTFTELQKWLKLSRPALSRHLAILREDETIEFEKKGREKYYKLKNIASKHLERNFDIISASYSEFFGYLLYESKHENFDDFIEFVNKKLNACFFFTIIKSLETGKNWLPAFDSKEMFGMTTDFVADMILRMDTKPNKTYEKIEESRGMLESDESFTEFNKLIKTDDRLKKNLKKLRKIIEQKYSEEIKLLENPRGVYTRPSNV